MGRGRVPGADAVACLAFDSSGDLYAGTERGGAFRSTDGGKTWTAVDSGIGRLSVISLKGDVSGRMFAGTSGRGVYRSSGR